MKTNGTAVEALAALEQAPVSCGLISLCGLKAHSKGLRALHDAGVIELRLHSAIGGSNDYPVLNGVMFGTARWL